MIEPREENKSESPANLVALLELFQEVEEIDPEFAEAPRPVEYSAKCTFAAMKAGVLKEIGSIVFIFGSTLLVNETERHHLGKTAYNVSLGELNQFILTHQKAGYIFQVDCSQAPSLSPEDLSVTASAYTTH